MNILRLALEKLPVSLEIVKVEKDKEDFRKLAKLHNEINRETGFLNNFDNLDDFLNSYESNERAGWKATVFGLKDNRNIFHGYCLCVYGPESKRGHISILCVDKENRGHGYGTMLLSKAKELFISEGAKKITINLLTDNERALKTYTKFGFKEVCKTTAMELEL